MKKVEDSKIEFQTLPVSVKDGSICFSYTPDNDECKNE